MEAFKRYWTKFERLNPWFAMTCYMATLVPWGILFPDFNTDRLQIAAVVIPVGLVFDYLLHKSHKGRPNWESAFITSAIVTVLMPNDISLSVALLAVAAALASKHFIRYKKRHIFNPASIGIVVACLLFPFSLGWWPDSYAWVTVFLGLVNVWRVKKYPQLLAYLATYVVLVGAISGFGAPELVYGNLGTQTFLLSLPWFFMLFMLPEPVTSRQQKRQQVEFGVLAAVAGIAFSYFPPTITPAISSTALLCGLLTANLYARFRKP